MIEPAGLLAVLGLGTMCMLILLKTTRLGAIWRSCRSHPYIFVFVALVFMTFTWPIGEQSAFNQGDELGAARTFRVVVFAGLLVALTVVLIGQASLPRRSALYLFAVYVGCCFLSSIYSPNPLETIWKSIELLVLVMFAFAVHCRVRGGKLEHNTVLDIIIFFLMFSSICAIVGIVLFPVAASPNQVAGTSTGSLSFGGIIPKVNANTLGQMGAMLALVGFIRVFLRRERYLGWLILLVLGVTVLLLAYSRTSLVAFGAVVAFLGFRHGFSLAGAAVAVGILCGILFAPEVLEYLSRGQDIELFKSMSGRTYIWAVGVEAFLERPWIGHGFYSGHKELDVVSAMAYSSLDSTYLEALVDVGLLGGLFLFVFIGRGLLIAATGVMQASGRDNPWGLTFFGFVFIMFVRSLTGPSFQALHLNILFYLLMISAWDARPAKFGLTK